jgi:hypothetical protein
MVASAGPCLHEILDLHVQRHCELSIEFLLILEAESRSRVRVQPVRTYRLPAPFADSVRALVEHRQRAIDVLEVGTGGLSPRRASRARRVSHRTPLNVRPQFLETLANKLLVHVRLLQSHRPAVNSLR